MRANAYDRLGGAVGNADHREKREKAIYWPLVLMGLFSNIVPGSLKFAIVVVAIVLLAFHTRGRLDFSFPRLSGFLLLVVVIGALSGFINLRIAQFGLYRFLRDCVYCSAPFLFWVLGTAMGKMVRDENALWTTLFVASGATALALLVHGMTHWSGDLTLSSFSANELTVYAVVLFLFKPEGWHWCDEHKVALRLLLIIDIIAIFVTLSRTTLVCLAIMLIIFAMRNNLKAFARVGGAILGFFLVALIAVQLMPGDTVQTFMDKIGNSLQEVSSARLTWSDEDINRDWRGYEVHVAQEAFSHGNAEQQLLGMGLGYQLDMGGASNTLLVTDDPVGIPYLHNGYMTVLLKCGIVGLILLIAFFSYHIIVLTRGWFTTRAYQNGLAAGIVCCIVVVTYVVHGLFQISAMWYFTIPLSMLYGFYHLGVGRHRETRGGSSPGERVTSEGDGLS